MLSVADNPRADGRVLSSVRSGVFAHLTSAKKLGIFHGRLLRSVLWKMLITHVAFVIKAADVSGNIADKVTEKLSSIIAPDKSSQYRKVARGAVTGLTIVVGFIILLEGFFLAAQFAAWLCILAGVLFITHNIMSTAIAGALNLSREIVDLFKNLYANPAKHVAEGKQGLERAFELALHGISAFVIGAIYITPSLLSVVSSIVLNPFYMLLNTVMPSIAVSEGQVLVDRAEAAVAEALEFSATKIDEAVANVRSSQNMCFQLSDPDLISKATKASKELYNLMSSTSEDISKELSKATKVIDTAIEESLDEATEDVLHEAKAVLEAHKVEISDAKHIRSTISMKLEAERGKRLESLTQETNAIKLLDLFKSLREPELDSSSSILGFISIIESEYTALMHKASATSPNARVFGEYNGVDTRFSDASLHPCFGHYAEVSCSA